MQGEDAEKLTRGVFYTRGNPFVFPAFRRWYEAARPRMPLLEPFAGVGQIPKLVAEAGFEADWDLYDIDRSLEGVRHNDSLASFPRGYEMTITNPPYLSLHQANRKKLGVRREDFRGYPSLYLVAVEEALRACRYVAMIIPESFITSGYFRERLEHFVSLPFQMFDDTEMPTALVMGGPRQAMTSRSGSPTSTWAATRSSAPSPSLRRAPSGFASTTAGAPSACARSTTPGARRSASARLRRSPRSASSTPRGC